MKIVASVLAALSLALASSASAAAPTKVLTLRAKTGPVAFDHKSHAMLKCTQCHTDERGGKIEGFGKTQDKDKAHAACHDCHKREGKGPQKCGDCHRRA